MERLPDHVVVNLNVVDIEHVGEEHVVVDVLEQAVMDVRVRAEPDRIMAVASSGRDPRFATV
jgi:sirohydrochlorin ferrochelatase